MTYPYKDHSLSIEERIEDLLARMSVDEKIGQMIQPLGWKAYQRGPGGSLIVTEEFRHVLTGNGVGSLYGVLRADPWTEVTLETGLSPRDGAEAINAIQKVAIEGTRWGIPLLLGEECSHGHMAIGATVFPTPIGAASTWNTPLYRKINRTVALETRAQGGAITYSPILDVVRDPRWGRTEETFGEDARLTAAFGVAAVQGLQGDSLLGDSAIVPTLKHFAGHGASEGGRNQAPVHVGPREFREKDLYPFRKAVEAGALSIMSAYHEIDGVPCTANRQLLTGLLREEWDFEGFVITDCGALQMMVDGHFVAEDQTESAILAVKAGVDMEMSGEIYGTRLKLALDQGRIGIGEIDEAVRRILRVKFRLGLFERPYVEPSRAELVIGIPEHRQMAREFAQESVVLLENRGGILPLSKSLSRIAVVGPNADNPGNQLGDYTSPQARSRVKTVLDGVRAAVSSETEVRYALGCRVKDPNKAGFTEAVEAVAGAEAAIVVLGGSSARLYGEGSVDAQTGASLVNQETALADIDCGEGYDRADLGLSGVQLDLLQELKATGVPLIVVLINGRPIIEPWLYENADAVLEAWYPGEAGGLAIADLIFGDASPSGKLPISIPRSIGQLPVHYDLKPMSAVKKYVEMDTAPQYPFGYGLSYTAFEYRSLSVKRVADQPGVWAEVEVDVVNTGGRAGYETVQFYVRDEVSSVTRPAKELKGFRKIYLEPGQSERVAFPVGREELQFVGPDLKEIVEPGTFTFFVGGNPRQLSEIRFTLNRDEI